MDSLFERYLTKIGANNEEMLLSFSNAYFKDYSYIKENHLYKAKVCINDLLDPKIYINLFKDMETDRIWLRCLSGSNYRT